MLATFFTNCLIKDDMLMTDGVSYEVEKIRKENPYYLSSRTYMMGRLINNGRHIYINRKNS
ncbi:MAG: hypothetical protein Kow0068_10450 [Marinilabiliales bacterium]